MAISTPWLVAAAVGFGVTAAVGGTAFALDDADDRMDTGSVVVGTTTDTITPTGDDRPAGPDSPQSPQSPQSPVDSPVSPQSPVDSPVSPQSPVDSPASPLGPDTP